MSCTGLMSGIYEQAHKAHEIWQKDKQRILDDVKGTPQAKVVRMLFKQHEIESIDHDLRGFECEESGETFYYRITFKDKQSLSEEHTLGEYIPAPTHVHYFSKLPMP